MYFNYKTNFEILPDEIILEICRYLHCSHVLYSFFDLNTRLNQTITFYCKHIRFRRATYKQLLYIYNYILPRIGLNIITLTLHPLHQLSFPLSYKENFSNIFPNLKILTLTSWTSDNLLLFIINNIEYIKYLEKLIIQELSCSLKISDGNFIENIFNIKNNFLTNIIFDYDCDSFDLTNYLRNNIISYNILYLTIQLSTLMDLSLLINYIPNIYQLDVSFRNSSLSKVSFEKTLPLLKKFSVWSIHYYSNFDDIISLLTIGPSIEQFSLIISTRDFNLINGKKILSIFSSQLKQFNYSVCYYPYDYNELFTIDNIQDLWQNIPIIYSINDSDKRIFLHTLPYSSSRLTIRSGLAKNMPIKNINQMYSKIKQIQIYSMTNISDVFPIIRQCRHIRELTLLTSNLQSIYSDNTNKQIVTLPYLNHLDMLIIEGIPCDLHHLKDLFIAAFNLSVLVIDLNCLITLLEDENQPLIIYVLLHRHILDLCIRISENNNLKLTIEQIHCIARIFTYVRNLTIDYETSEEFIQLNIIKTIINEFKQLIIFHIYGKIPNDITENNIQQWIIEQNFIRIKSTDIFRVECSDQSFKLWL